MEQNDNCAYTAIIIRSFLMINVTDIINSDIFKQ